MHKNEEKWNVCYVKNYQNYERISQTNRKIQFLIRNMILPWILPIDVQTIEFVFSEKIDGFVNEIVHAEGIARKFFEWR